MNGINVESRGRAGVVVRELPLCGDRSKKGRWVCIRAPHPKGTVHVYGRRFR